MKEHILVTGGAGFIGSHIVDMLVSKGYYVRVIDHLSHQVHPDGPPDYLNPQVEYIWGDLEDASLVERALKDVEVIIHQASEIGVGQSMYDIRRFATANVLGTATLLEEIIHHHRSTIRKLIVASSMSVYGEGAYRCLSTNKEFHPQCRPLHQLEQHEWEVLCEDCRKPLIPIPISEDASLYPASIYSITKRDQEEMCLSIGRTYEIPTIAFRYFNVYGPRQSLSNPFTGLAAMFITRLLNKKAPLIFEDGNQIRDFIHVSDVARINVQALEMPIRGCHVYNLSCGEPIRVIDIAKNLRSIIKPTIEPEITHIYRKGDIRHCYADTSRLRRDFNFEPSISLEHGLADLVKWAEEEIAHDYTDMMCSKLHENNLII